MKTYSSIPGRERFRSVSCNLCGGRSHRRTLVCRDYTFVKCNLCGLVYQNPQPVFSDLKHRYRQNYFEYELQNETNFFHLMKLGLEDIRFSELTADLNGRKKFLDVGCATGMLLDHLRALGWAVQGVELCPESAEYGVKMRRLDIFVGSLEEALFPDASFPVVHFSHLIEHVPDPKKFVAEVHRILSPGGHVVVVTPNIDGLQARIFRRRWRSAIADHLTLFSRKTLHRMLSEAGFQVLKSVTWGGLAKGSVPGLIKRPVDHLAKKLGFGDVVLMLARKVSQGEGGSHGSHNTG